MGQQQLLLIVLGVIIVGIAIWAGIALFSAHAVAANKDAIITDLEDLEQDVAAYSMRQQILGGGGGSINGYSIKSSGPWGTGNPNATYTVQILAREALVIGTSKTVTGAFVLIVFDTSGKLILGPLSNGYGG